MRPLRAAWNHFRNLFRTRKLDRDLDAELAVQLELHTADNLRAGMSTTEARRRALLRLDGIATRPDDRSLLGFPWHDIVVPLPSLATGVLACYVPARRAARVDPMTALRYE